MKKFFSFLIIIFSFCLLTLTSCGKSQRIQIKNVSALKNYDTYILLFESDVPVERYQIEYKYLDETIKEVVATDYYKIKLLTDMQRSYTFIITAIGDDKDTTNSAPYQFKLDAEKFKVPEIKVEVEFKENKYYIIYFNEDKNINYILKIYNKNELIREIKNIHSGHDFSVSEIEKIIEEEITGDDYEITVKVESSEDNDYFRNTESEMIPLFK